MPAAPPAADTKKPATPPPAKAGDDKAKAGGPESKSAGGKAGEKASEKTDDKSAQEGKAATAGQDKKGAADADKSATTANQQRFDRMAVRAKFAVSEPGDAIEREADAVADKVMRMADGPECPSCSAAAAKPEAKDKVTRAVDPDARGGANGSTGDTSQQAAKGSPGTPTKAPPVAVGSQKPVTTGGTKGGAATEQRSEQPPQVQRQAAGKDKTGRPTVPNDFATRLGEGEPLDAAVRAFFERRFGQDLSQVRIHTDANAQKAAAEISARAFTFGRHIAFAVGQYQPDSDAGKRLLSHELAHVVQQQDQSVARQIMRQSATTTPAGGDKEDIAVKGVSVPAFKIGYYDTPSYKRAANYRRSKVGSKQKSIWDKATSGVPADFVKDFGLEPDGVYVAVPKKVGLSPTATELLVGKPKAISELVRRPRWRKDGTSKTHDIDHRVELQIGGQDFDRENNLELRDSKANQDSGRSIDDSITEQLKLAKDKEGGDPDKIRASARYMLVFSDFKSSGGATDSSCYKLADINKLEGAEGLDVYDPDKDKKTPGGGKSLPWPNKDKTPFFGSPDLLVLYPSRRGGVAQQLKLTPDRKKLAPGATVPKTWIPGFELTDFDFNAPTGDDIGNITMTLKVDGFPGGYPPQVVPIRKLSGKLTNAGFISTEGVRNKISALLNNKMSPVPQSSPVEVNPDDVDILPGSGLTITGIVKPELPIFKGTTIDFEVSGRSFQLSKTFTADEMKLPGPFKITSSSITVAINSSAGFSVTGAMNFEIKGLGEGSLKGVGTTSKFGIGGEFVFDRKLFDGEAVLKATYVKESESSGKFKGEAHLEIGKKIKGIKQAKIHAIIDNETFSANGTADADIPGLKQFNVKIDVTDAEHFTASGDGQFEKLPGIKSGKLTMTLEREGSEWSLSGAGSAIPDLPGGVNASLSGSYKRGVVVLKGVVNFSYGQGGTLTGHGTVVVTNADSVDAKGNVGDSGGKNFKAYGSAQLTAKLGPITGTVDLEVKPTGQLSIGGTLKMPDQQLFGVHPEGDASKRTLGKISTPHVPLVGVPLVGIALWAEGSIDAHASVGPGMIKNINVAIEPFDPANFSVDSLRIKGGADLEAPAQAGLDVNAGIIIAAEVVAIKAGAELRATVTAGLPPVPPAITGGVDFTWSNQEGFDVNAGLSITAQPEVKFSLAGKLFARADLCVDTITLWERSYQLAEAKTDLPIKISGSAKFGWNSRQGFRFDPKKDIVIPKPELKTSHFLDMLSGKAKSEKLEDQDKNGKPIPSNEQQVCVAPTESNASVEPNQSVMPKQEEGATGPDPVDENIVDRLGTGIPLDLSTRGYFEQRMQADLTRVRIHAGPTAAREAENLSAEAFTVGDHIAFAAGKYQPDTPEGQELIAHELAHVAQQQGGGAPIVLRWPAVTRTPAHTDETPATIKAKTLADFVLLTRSQLDWATSPDIQADAAALGQFRDLQTFADGAHINEACGDLKVGDIIGKGLPGIYVPLRKYTEGVTSHATAWLRETSDIDKAERWGKELATLEAAWPAANLSLVMKAPDPVTNDSPFERLDNPAKPELANFINYLNVSKPILSADDGSEVDSFLKLRSESVLPEGYLGSIAHVKNYHHFTKNTLEGQKDNEAFPQAMQKWAWFQRPLTVVLYPAVDHNGAFHRNLGLEAMVKNTDILTIVVEGFATVDDYQTALAPVAARYGINGEISQAMIAGHGNATLIELAGTTAGAGVTHDSLGTTGAGGTHTKDLMTELTRLMSGDPKKRRIVLDACLTNSHQVATALRAAPADAAADVNTAIAGNPDMRGFVAGMAGAGANVFGADASFAPARTTFMTPGTGDIGLSVPTDPDLIANKLQYVEFGTEPEGCMRAVLECWATDQLAGTHDCRDAMLRRIGAGKSAKVAAADSWREHIIQPLYDLAANHYWGSGDAIRRMSTLAAALFELYWANKTSAATLNASLGVLTSAAHVDTLLTSVSGDPHYATTPRVAVVIEQAWMQHTPARRAQFLVALGRYRSCSDAAADVDMGLNMAHVPLLLTLPPAVPPPADQLRLALMAAHRAPVGVPPPSPLPSHVVFLRSLLGVGPTFPAVLAIDAALGSLATQDDILAAIGKPLAAPAGARDPRAPPPAANIDTIRNASKLNDFRVTPLRRGGTVSTVRDDLVVRSTPTTSTDRNIFNRLPKGTSVFVIGEFGDWYAIEQTGRTGFVAKRNIKLGP